MNKIVLVSKKDLVITWFNGGGGGGGQNRNRHNNCCRIHHPASGVTTTSSKHKEAKSNQAAAFIALTEHFDFKKWLNLKLKELETQQTIEERVQKQLKPSNLLIETIIEGQWIELKD